MACLMLMPLTSCAINGGSDFCTLFGSPIYTSAGDKITGKTAKQIDKKNGAWEEFCPINSFP